MSYLLDTSAWLAHVFDESGAEEIDQFFGEPQIKVCISALSLVEVNILLKAIGRQKQWSAVYSTYSALFAEILPVDEQVANLAIQLRAATPVRLPTIDGLIAATAVAHNLTLVHRDAHLSSVPGELLRQIKLPDHNVPPFSRQ